MQFILWRSERLPALTHCVTTAREDTATRDEDVALLGRRCPSAG
jgi:hypothetical protein